MKRTDEELVQQTLDGDTGAFAELVERYRDAAYGVGLHVLGDAHAAAEVAQDAFLRAWRALGQLALHDRAERGAQASVRPGRRRVGRLAGGYRRDARLCGVTG